MNKNLADAHLAAQDGRQTADSVMSVITDADHASELQLGVARG